MQKQKLLFLLSFLFLIIEQSCYSQEVRNIEELVYGNDAMKLQYVYPLNRDYFFVLDNSYDRFQLLVIDQRNYDKNYNDLSSILEMPGRIRLYDYWRESLHTFIASTAMGNVAISLSDTVNLEVINRRPLKENMIYDLGEWEVGFDRVEEKTLKKQKKFNFLFFDVKKSEFSKWSPQKIIYSKEFFYNLNDWNVYFDRERLLLPFVNIIDKNKWLINYPQSHNFGLFIGGKVFDFSIPSEFLEGSRSSFAFPVMNSDYIAIVIRYRKTYSVYFLNISESTYTLWSEMNYRPYAFSKEGAFYRIPHRVNGKKVFYQYQKRYDNQTSVVLERAVNVKH